MDWKDWLNKTRREESRYVYQPLPKWQSAGGVILRGLTPDDIRVVYLIKPSGGWNGGKYTFPKGKVDVGETPEVAAIREVEEETGLKAHHIADSYLGDGEGTMSKTRYYLMVFSRDLGYGPDFETEDVRPVLIEEAIRYFKANGCTRDLRVAELALERINELQNNL